MFLTMLLRLPLLQLSCRSLEEWKSNVWDCHLIVVEPAESEFPTCFSPSWIIWTVGQDHSQVAEKFHYSLEERCDICEETKTITMRQGLVVFTVSQSKKISKGICTIQSLTNKSWYLMRVKWSCIALCPRAFYQRLFQDIMSPLFSPA